jgi:hypothetical protein
MGRKHEADLNRYDLSKGSRGGYVEVAKRTFETIVVDRNVASALGGAEGLDAMLEAFAKSVMQVKKRRRDA